MNEDIRREVMLAYSDCHGTEEQMNAGYKTRNLNFKASAPVPRDEAIAIMKKATPNGYNEFTASKLKLLPEGSMVLIGREGSPAIHVTPPIEQTITKMEADDWSTEDGVTRIWWD